jgi:hypothetical protein
MDDTTPNPGDGQDWLETWKKNLAQIDDKLVELYKETSEKTGDLLEHAKAKVQELLDKTDMDEKARARWDKAKADGKLVGDQLEKRVKHLIADGRITWDHMTKKERHE